ncbi:MAG: transcriptional regulator [Oscillospiraceae bacterium]|nr:transcriptional regulator [Oscillospiraceae bacterium]
MLQDETRELLVKEYEKTRDAKKIAGAYGVSVSTVYRLAKQKATTGSVKLQVNRRGRKRVLTEEDLRHIEDMIQKQPGVTLREIVEALNLNAGGETVRRAIKRMGYSYHRKKKIRRISKRDHTRYISQSRRGEKQTK